MMSEKPQVGRVGPSSARPGPARPPTLLGVWAHPDDEAYLSAGLMLDAVRAGHRVVVTTATRGELGTADPANTPPHVVARLREQEMVRSLSAVGVTEHRWPAQGSILDGRLQDGRLAEVPEEIGVELVADELRRVRPDLVVTFGPDGLTGHHDHAALSRWVTGAWHATGCAAELWYAAVSVDFLDTWGDLCADLGVWMNGIPPRAVEASDLAHLRVCEGDALDRKYEALRAHVSQTAGLISQVGEERYRAWWSTEAFVRASRALDAVA